MNLKNPIETIKEVHIEDLKSLEHPSSFIREEDYRVLILRHLSLFESGLNYESKGFIIQNETIHIYNREKSSFELLPNGFPGLLQSIVPIHNEHKKLIDGYTNEIDALEDKLYTNKISRYFMDVWFDAKKDLTKFERYYQRNILVLKDVCKEYETHKNFPKTNFYDLIEDINAYIVGIQNQLHKLDSIHHYYVSLKDDRLNKNIYYLTLISATFLPLNLVVGFFGMNTEGL
ncbi:MAG: hypothetical protein KDK45_25825, partial [Leptospiraceae bacterium]|nr:hypothetical protein [Leptospiraceae bacterium]